MGRSQIDAQTGSSTKRVSPRPLKAGAVIASVVPSATGQLDSGPQDEHNSFRLKILHPHPRPRHRVLDCRGDPWKDVTIGAVVITANDDSAIPLAVVVLSD
jgi:hypothetical protein